jgi:hypothetical protein
VHQCHQVTYNMVVKVLPNQGKREGIGCSILELHGKEEASLSSIQSITWGEQPRNVSYGVLREHSAGVPLALP